MDPELSRGLIDCYFGGRNGQQLVKHQIDSYNDFISRKLEQIVEGFNPIDVCNTYLPEAGCYKYVVSVAMQNPALSRPLIYEKDGSTKAMLPNDARLRNLTYAAPLSVDICITAKTWSPEAREYVADNKRINAVSLGRVPVMVRSRYCALSHPNQVPNGMDECRHDYGGYFVINGSEKVVISQDRIAENRAYVFLNTKASCYSHVAEIRSVQEDRFGVPKTLTLKLSSKANNFGRTVKLCMHHIKHDVPVVIMFRALGVESDRDIVRYIIQDEDDPISALLETELVGCLDEGSSIRTQQAAQEYLAAHLTLPHHHQQHQQQHPSDAHRMGVLRSVLRKDLLPHVGQEPLKKALYIGHMIGRLMRCYLGLRPLDDRDSYVNKRLDTPGVLIANLFRQYYGKVVKDMRTLIQKEINGGSWKATNKLINVVGKSNVYKLIKPTIIEAGLKYGLATGNWGVKTR
jgi:DNA-directed RNA polymerase II subunit RPB2